MRTHSRARLLGPVLAASVLPLLATTPAQAIPEDGASADTPGTSASVSPTRLSAGSVLSFRIQGFPAGEVVSVKVDDGLFCSASGVHGACVVHQQRISSSGTASGSFVLPADLKVGTHWLRFLASKEAHSADGTYLGTQGFTLRGRSTFTIVAPAHAAGATAQPSTSGSGGTTGSLTGEASGTTGATAIPTAPGSTPGASESSVPAGVATPGAEISLQLESSATPGSGASQPSASPRAVSTTSPDPTQPTDAPAQATSGADTREIPWVGLAGGGAATVVAAGLLWWPRRRSVR